MLSNIIDNLNFRNLKWSKDGNVLATVTDKLGLWSETGISIGEQLLDHQLWSVDWNRNGDQLATTDEQGNVLIFDMDLKKLNEYSWDKF